MSSLTELVRRSLGATLLGVFLSSTLHGVTCLQAILYFNNFPKDGRWLKSGVTVLMLVEFAHIALCWHFMYQWCITTIVSPDVLGKTIWSTLLTVPVTGLTEAITHIFFIARIWKCEWSALFSGGMDIKSSAGVLEAGRIEFRLILQPRYRYPLWVEFGTHLKAWIPAMLLMSSITDAAITCVLCFCLHQSRSTFKQTDTLITIILQYTLGSGFMTAIGDLIVVILFFVFPEDTRYLAVYEVTSKCKIYI
ncbi:hypothetical protein SISNIDRAFT_471183 [Sistotremastrum niveocremeum HHB9708]|uniref:DUF6534 domain-containing protein n=1 Tax=Sistotremastrum niveocremeum HHB9708 TaxID=1314777 RepID=A0A164MY24_9AGAM|nr:hypothetical protein SISNIDRAFT_471183 [Sistotremastrum niveocremeum HHB9708]